MNQYVSPPQSASEEAPKGVQGLRTLSNTSSAMQDERRSSSASQGISPVEKKKEEPVAPAWTEMKTKAGKERKRLPLACIACRRKKIRCSGEHPACKHCLRSRIPCVYKVSARKAAPRTDYMAMLDKRLKRMEERVIKIIPKEEQGILAATGRASVKPAPPALSRRASSAKKRTAEQTVEDLEAWTRNSQPRASGHTAAALEATRKAHELSELSLLKEGAEHLPSKEIQEHLAEVFFDYVYGQSYHLLHKPSFMRRLTQGEVAPVLCLSVCAMAARFSSHPAVRTEPAFLRGEEWAAAARDIAIKRYDKPNITILISYLILTLHEFGTCQGVRSWMFAGLAQRMAFAMQLHQELEFDPCAQIKQPLSSTDREIRRRALWACFMTDRFTSSGTERPTFININHISTKLPITENFFQMELDGPTEDLLGNAATDSATTDQLSNAKDNLGVAAYMIRMVNIWGNCINYFNLGGKEKEQHPMWDERSSFMALRSSVRAFKESLPARLHYTADNLAAHASDKIANQFIFMHIIYHQTALFVNRFALPLVAARTAADTGIPTQFIQESANAALKAANCISSLVHEGMNHNVVAPFAGYSAFFSSSVHIQGAFSNNEALVASSNKYLTWNVQYLSKMKRHWGVFHLMTENLRALYKNNMDASRASGHELEKGSEAIFQYGDWFDRYPHGVSGADYEEPQGLKKGEPGADAGLGQQSDLQSVEEFFSSNLSPTVQTATVKKPRKQSKKAVAEQAVVQVPTGQQVAEMYSHLENADMTTSPVYPAQYNQAFPPQLNQVYIDRQTALSAYSDFDPGPAMNFSLPGVSFDLGAMNMNSIAQMGSMPDLSADQSTYQVAASGGWFMPMQMDASALAEASGLFSTGSFDWTTQFDMSNMQQPMMAVPQQQFSKDGVPKNNRLDAG